MNAQNIVEWINQRSEIESVFACVCDLNGTLRGKRVPADQVPKILQGEIRMPLSLLNLDIWGEDIENSALVFERAIPTACATSPVAR